MPLLLSPCVMPNTCVCVCVCVCVERERERESEWVGASVCVSVRASARKPNTNRSAEENSGFHTQQPIGNRSRTGGLLRCLDGRVFGRSLVSLTFHCVSIASPVRIFSWFSMASRVHTVFCPSRQGSLFRCRERRSRPLPIAPEQYYGPRSALRAPKRTTEAPCNPVKTRLKSPSKSHTV